MTPKEIQILKDGWDGGWNRGFIRGKDIADNRWKKKIMELIDDERDNGNIGLHQFSPAICLSHIIKLLENGNEM